MGHLVKLNMEARLVGRRGQLPEVSTVHFYCHDGVADVNHIPVISTIMAIVKILAWDQLLNISCASWNHLGGNGSPYSFLKKVKMLSSFYFFMHNMPTTEVIDVVNSLNKDQILNF